MDSPNDFAGLPITYKFLQAVQSISEAIRMPSAPDSRGMLPLAYRSMTALMLTPVPGFVSLRRGLELLLYV